MPKNKTLTKKISNFIQNFFKDKNGKVIITQSPNWPLWLAIFLWVIALLPISAIKLFSAWMLIPTMLYWSYLEIFKGDNSFRRLLGIIVTIYFINKLFLLFI